MRESRTNFTFSGITHSKGPEQEFLFLSSLPDNELLFRSRDGDVLKFNVDTKEQSVVVPNQLFVCTACLK